MKAASIKNLRSEAPERPHATVSEVLPMAVAALEQSFGLQVHAIVEATGCPAPAASRILATELSKSLRYIDPAASLQTDLRASTWQIRVRLYSAANMDEPQADSDPELPPDRLGLTKIKGLPAVAEHLAALAAMFHGTTCAGLEMAVLRHRLKALRPTISRRGGDAVWRVPYQVAGSDWLARVDIQRVGDTNENHETTTAE